MACNEEQQAPRLRYSIFARAPCLSGRRGFGYIAVFSAVPGKWPLLLWLRRELAAKKRSKGHVHITPQLCGRSSSRAQRILQRDN